MCKVRSPLLLLVLGVMIFSCNAPGSDALIIDDEKDTGFAPAFAVNGNIVAGTWFRSGNRTMVLGVSRDQGATWAISMLEPPTEMNIVLSNRVIMQDLLLYSCFYEQRSKGVWLIEVNLENGSYRYVKLVNGEGKTFNSLAFAISGTIAHVACGFDYSLQYARLDLSSAEKAPVAVMVDSSAVSKGALDAAIAVEGADVYVAYWGSYTGVQKGTSLRLAHSGDGGESWKSSDIRDLNDPTCSTGRQPSLFAADRKLWILYLAKTDIGLQYWDGNRWNVSVLAERAEKPYSHPMILNEDGNLIFSWMYDGWLVVSNLSGEARRLVRVDPALSMRPDRACLVVVGTSRIVLRFQCETKEKKLVMTTYRY